MDGGQIQRIAASRSPVCSFHLCKKVLQNENFNGKRGVQPSYWCLTSAKTSTKTKIHPFEKETHIFYSKPSFLHESALLFRSVSTTSRTTWKVKTHTGWHPKGRFWINNKIGLVEKESTTNNVSGAINYILEILLTNLTKPLDIDLLLAHFLLISASFFWRKKCKGIFPQSRIQKAVLMVVYNGDKLKRLKQIVFFQQEGEPQKCMMKIMEKKTY